MESRRPATFNTIQRGGQNVRRGLNSGKSPILTWYSVVNNYLVIYKVKGYF